MDILSIIIINWNSSQYLKNCIDSIYYHNHNHDISIVVLDNASFDGSKEIVESYPGNIRFIQLIENVGFAKANNIGFSNVHSKYCLFLNPDTIIKQDVFKAFIDIAENESNVGAIGCQLLNENGTIQNSSIQPFPTIVNQMVNCNFVVNHSKLIKIQRNKLCTPVEVDIISGACFFVVSDVFKRVGAFSTDYFMYGEDLDLCYKIKKEGYKILFTNSFSIIHFGGKSSNKRSMYYASVLLRESVYILLKKFKGLTYCTGYRIGIAVSALFRCLLILPILMVDSKDFKYIFEKWFRIFRWAFGFEKWVKQLTYPNKI